MADLVGNPDDRSSCDATRLPSLSLFFSMKINELLNALINVAEKGANIARIIRSEKSLLELLVQEKKGDRKNARFLQDFKTLADVLVQELVKYDLSRQVIISYISRIIRISVLGLFSYSYYLKA